ncbi:MAG TPA: hypothetical protein PK104_06750 [Spirochaetota bacterium]|jgi:hypothetical protein|nr:hypothetical protein [Spirochaetota bacterium]HOQ12043.1 hypothetical protein [Spirochaetota bacterium]HOV09010.1 hypothetical protein [Spirochaetota bacterium]
MKYFFKTLLTICFIIWLCYKHSYATQWYDPTSYDNHFNITFAPVFLIPLGDFEDLFSEGYGGLISLNYISSDKSNNLFSFRTGYIRLNAKEETEEGYPSGVYDGYIIPFLINYEYRFSIFTYLDIAPTISAGISLNKSAYDDKSKTISGGLPTGYTPDKEKPVMKFEPMALAGLNLLYILTFEDSIFIKIEYGSIYEQNADIFFGLLSIGYEKRF